MILICIEKKLQPVERVGRSVLNDDKVPENLLVLSCEEDRDISIPFLERGKLHFDLYNSWLVYVVDYARNSSFCFFFILYRG